MSGNDSTDLSRRTFVQLGSAALLTTGISPRGALPSDLCHPAQ